MNYSNSANINSSISTHTYCGKGFICMLSVVLHSLLESYFYCAVKLCPECRDLLKINIPNVCLSSLFRCENYFSLNKCLEESQSMTCLCHVSRSLSVSSGGDTPFYF